MLSRENSVNADTTREFLRSFSLIDVEESDSDFEELSTIPETPADQLEDYNDATNDQNAGGSTVIPYCNVFKPPVPFSSQRENCWIPGVAIHVEIKDHERQATSHMLNPNLYKIEVKHGDFQWTIYRRYKHFRQLHDSLVFFLARYKMPLPNKDYHQRRATIIKDIRGHKQRQKDSQQRTVRLPKRPEALVSEDKIEVRKKQLEEYLKNLVTCKSYRNHPETLKFFEVSHLSFVSKLGLKAKEGLVEKCSGGRRINIQCCGCLKNVHFAGTWNKRWLVVKDNFILYIRPEDGQVSDVLLMDSVFSVKHGLSNTGTNRAILIETLSRKLLIKCWTNRQAREWADEIKLISSSEAIDYTQKNRFNSFAPVRESTFARWFVDGRCYFEAVADALEKAKEEIYITDWWLSPEIYLKRPIVDGDHWRLDVILKRKAKAGVKVFVLLYKEIGAALSIKSIYSKEVLKLQCPENIKVLRHPDHIPGKGVLLWAHHEKLVIIDQQIAFTGGLDLCYGRWDDEFHKLTDLGSVSLLPKDKKVDNGHDLSSNTELSVISSDNTSINVTPLHQKLGERKNTSSGFSSIPSGLESPSSFNTSSVQQSASQPVSSPSRSLHPSPPGSLGSQLPSQYEHRSPSPHRSPTNSPRRSPRTSPHCSPRSSPHCSPRSSPHCSPRTSPHCSPKRSLYHSPTTSPQHSPTNSCQPVEAKVLVRVTHPSFERQCDTEVVSVRSYHSNSSLGSTGKELQPQSLNFRYSHSDNDSEKKILSKQPDSASSAVDTEGFSETELKEINQFMQPFRDFQKHYRHKSDNGGEAILNVPCDSGIPGLNPLFDKEIICSPDATDMPDFGGSSPSTDQRYPHSSPSPKNRARSPILKHKNQEKKSSNENLNGKPSHLWRRRSKNNQSLQLKIPNSSGSLNGNSPLANEGMQESGLQPAGPSRNGTHHLSIPFKSSKKKVLNVQGDVRYNISTEALEVSANQSGIEGQCKLPASAPTVGSSRPLSFASTVTTANAMRKLFHSKETNNNDHMDNDLDKNNLARRRWKMIFNVSKFESIVRSPQEPERIDESLFYNQNIKHPSTRNKLVKSFKDGVDRLKRHGRQGSIEDLNILMTIKNNLTVPRTLYHTQSEEDILERGLEGSTKLWIGKDYVNFIHKDFVELHQPFEDFINRSETPRMPWHDIGCVVYGKSARDLARHFIERWNFTKLEKFKRDPNYPLLLPKTTSKYSIPSSIKGITFEVKAQVLRSSSGWSAGIGHVEKSIHSAYQHCIENARDYIYIENQFFITLVDGHSVNNSEKNSENNSVKNCIGNALYRRILRAHRANSNFKVYVVMPLLPAFEGEFGTSTGVALQAVTHWNYSSICRGGNSLMEKLAKEIPDPNKYIVFCGLRTWDKLHDKLVTELVYVHSKLMIVDDDTVIIGSANINDRSLLGNRDSEIAVMFEDVHKTDVMVDNKAYRAGKFASQLRWTIFREHLGIHNEADYVNLTDISCDSFYKDVWIKRAAVNTTCFDKVFRCLPTDNVKNFSELKQYQTVKPLAQTDGDEAMKLLNKVKGYLVLLPLQFLRDEILTPKVGQKEALLPNYLWT